jgi:hypothetical protein
MAMRGMFHRLCFLLPLLLSLAAFGLVVFALLTGRARPGGDEGAAAHLFQLLIVAQVPLIAGFVLTAERPRAMAAGLAVQALAVAAALAPVLIAGL